MSCNSQSPLAAQVRQSSGWSLIYSSIMPLRIRCSLSDWVWTTMPSATGVVQDAGVPRRPSISTTHRRQEPNASILSLAQSFGTMIPASAAARMTDVPSGTVISNPSTVTVTGAPTRAGVPMSRSSPGGN